LASPQAVKVIILLKNRKSSEEIARNSGKRGRGAREPAQTADAYMGGNSLKLQAMP